MVTNGPQTHGCARLLLLGILEPDAVPNSLISARTGGKLYCNVFVIMKSCEFLWVDAMHHRVSSKGHKKPLRVSQYPDTHISGQAMHLCSESFWRSLEDCSWESVGICKYVIFPSCLLFEIRSDFLLLLVRVSVRERAVVGWLWYCVCTGFQFFIVCCWVLYWRIRSATCYSTPKWVLTMPHFNPKMKILSSFIHLHVDLT